MAEGISEIPRMRPDMTPAELRALWISVSDMTEEEFDDMMAANKARQARVPKVGDAAPDFEIDVLDAKKKRTGETVRLSGLRGKPVALVFGSYT